ncbi:MAG TPA: IPTL-CTERM sorting domain-containing protein [Candidatus Competibacteraceae bacterium]|nr:IPTL-CTERM sorting domain-containing protein [Candidatus Competibacteraceae bacterium]
MRTPHSFTPHRLATAVVLALSGPSALAADFYVGANSDPGDSDPASLDCSNASNTTCTLSAAIYAANQASGSDTIFLTTDVTLTGIMQRLIDSDMTLDGQGHTIEGGDPNSPLIFQNHYRPFFVKSGTVTIKNMTLHDGVAKGGNSGGGGGGGAGLGGALFVYNGNVTVENVIFSDNIAQGGEGGTNRQGGSGGMFGSGYYGGGGLFGSSTDSNGGYGGNSNYGGGGGSSTNGTGSDGGFGGGGGGSRYSSPDNTNNILGGNGGFGGGGGGSINNSANGTSTGGNGGFGGGGGGSINNSANGASTGGNGGVGGGGGPSRRSTNNGSGGYGGSNGSQSGGGGEGAGFGGAIFVKRGTLTLKTVQFTSNLANLSVSMFDSEGRGGAIFICTPDLDNDNTAKGAKGGCGGKINEVKSCEVTFDNNQALTGQNELFWTGAAGSQHSTAGITDPCTTIPPTTSPIPTLSEWGLLLMSSLLGLFGAWRTRKARITQKS